MKFSIITATYNSSLVIEDCLLSIASQTYKNFEHIVVDGSSNDGTLGIMKSYSSSFSVFISEPDKGIYDALNKGIKNSSGDVIGFLHSDDLFYSNDVLKSVAAIFSTDASINAVYGDLELVQCSRPEKVIRTWRSSSFSSHLLKLGWMPAHPTLYVRREWYERIGGFDTRYRIAADYFSILQLFSQPDFKAVYLPKTMIRARLGGASNRSLRAVLKKSAEDWNVLRRSGFGIIGATRALVLKNLRKISQFF